MADVAVPVALATGLAVIGTWTLALYALQQIDHANGTAAHWMNECLAAERDLRLNQPRPVTAAVVPNPAPGITDQQLAEFLAETDGGPILYQRGRGRPPTDDERERFADHYALVVPA